MARILKRASTIPSQQLPGGSDPAKSSQQLEGVLQRSPISEEGEEGRLLHGEVMFCREQAAPLSDVALNAA